LDALLARLVLTVISLAGGKAISDFDGVDVGNDKRIPKTYFDSICLIKLKVN